jgi:hypothetical protein
MLCKCVVRARARASASLSLSSRLGLVVVEPVLRRVRDAEGLGRRGAVQAVATGRGDAVDLGEADGGALVAELQPVDGARVEQARVGVRGRVHVGQLAALEERAGRRGRVQVESGRQGGVKVVAAQRGQRRGHARQRQGRVLTALERVGRVRGVLLTHVAGVGVRGQVQRHRGLAQDVDRELLLLRLGQRRVQRRDVVQHGERAEGRGVGAGGAARVVLDAVAQANVQKSAVGSRKLGRD